MLLGEFRCTTDATGQLRLPAAFQGELRQGLTLTRGIERCLFVFPASEWQALAAKTRSRLHLTNPDARAFSRLIFAGALPCTPDQEGQITLPHHLRQYAGIESEVVLIGLCTHLEVWSPQRWQEASAQMEEERIAIAERLSQQGI